MSNEVEVKTTDFYEVIRDRHSVRTYDPTYKLSGEEIRSLLEEAILAPSSSNLQPWRFLVIQDQELKEKLLPIANNQQQVVQASAVIAVLADLEGFKQGQLIYGRSVEQGFMPEEVLSGYVARITGYYSEQPERYRDTALIDAGLISMQLMLAAKARGLDTVPMGGYDSEKFVEAFNIPSNLKPVILLPVGKAVGEGRKSVRLTVDEVTTWETF
ncbi:nitroreductase family protein [Paenibacillus sp. GCM10012307]|uniref:Nitroreductase family protein n=1 Tax=Paenibacillus roseus TaxID=2798579 RepID=A0A934J6Q8_9BACL|nr:nitroreductase family protein [Paenibacillus roseus]MBJ6361318.1 nitroreductase family protein [Paenibacillus roseus]